MVLNKDEKIENNLYFEILSHIPLERELFDLNILNKTELDWINKYHTRVYEKLSSKLKLDQRTWLKNATLPV